MTAEDATLLDLAIAKSGRPGPRCRIAALTSTHPKAAQIAELIAACPERIQYSTAHETLKEAGIEVSADSLSRHVRGRCSCPAS